MFSVYIMLVTFEMCLQVVNRRCPFYHYSISSFSIHAARQGEREWERGREGEGEGERGGGGEREGRRGRDKSQIPSLPLEY